MDDGAKLIEALQDEDYFDVRVRYLNRSLFWNSGSYSWEVWEQGRGRGKKPCLKVTTGDFQEALDVLLGG